MLYFFKSFMIFFSLRSFFSLFFTVVKKKSTDNIEKKSVQSMDTKQANLTGPCDRVCSESPLEGRLASLVPREKAKSSSSGFSPCSAAREMRSQSL